MGRSFESNGRIRRLYRIYKTYPVIAPPPPPPDPITEAAKILEENNTNSGENMALTEQQKAANRTTLAEAATGQVPVASKIPATTSIY